MNILEERRVGLLAENPRYQLLWDQLLEAGGDAIAFRHESDLELLLERGEVFGTKDIQMMLGEPCRCHSNAALCWEANKDQVQIATGWALSNDRMWRQHSWCYHCEDDTIIETTEERELYFGILLSDEEAADFLEENE